ncbi:phosphatidylserine decarboxylase, partial [Oleiphilus sp. HI0079]
VDKLHYISGDTFNVNPPTLKRINRLFCRNERAVIEIKPTNFEGRIAMIPVAAILVASMRFVGLEHPLSLAYRGPNEIPFKRSFERGERIGNFEHGSTIVLLFSEHYSFMPQIREGEIIRMGQPLMTQKQQ